MIKANLYNWNNIQPRNARTIILMQEKIIIKIIYFKIMILIKFLLQIWHQMILCYQIDHHNNKVTIKLQKHQMINNFLFKIYRQNTNLKFNRNSFYKTKLLNN